LGQKNLLIEFHGAYSDNHQIDMRQFGYSLIGIERILRIGFICFSSHRFPKRGEESPVSIFMTQPYPGSYGFTTIIQEVAGSNYPLLNQFFVEQGHRMSLKWLSGILLNRGGREEDSLQMTNDLVQIITNYSDGIDQRRHEEIMELIKRPELSRSAREIVKPIGKSSNKLMISDGNGDKIEIDEPIADSIRSKDKLEVGEMETFVVRVDGFTHHNKQLKITHPNEPGRFINGKINDPEFNNLPNIYTKAASENKELKVTAKPTLKEGRITTLYISDAEMVE